MHTNIWIPILSSVLIAGGSIVLLKLAKVILRYTGTSGYYKGIPRPHADKLLAIFGTISKNGGVERFFEEVKKPGNKEPYEVCHQGIGFSGQHTIGISHPDDLKMILSDQEVFVKDETYQILSLVLGGGLVTSQGAHWKTHRRVLTPSFHFQFLKNLFHFVVNQSQEMLDRIRASNSQPLLAFDLFGETTLSVMIKTSVGEGTVDVTSMATCFQDVLKSLDSFFLFYAFIGGLVSYLPLPFVWRFHQKRRELNAMILKATSMKRGGALSQASSKKGSPKDFISLMIESGFSDEEIQDETTTFFFAGHDTTSSCLTWCLYFLAMYPEEQKKIQEELDQAQFSLETVTMEKLEELPRTKMFIYESLRMRPPVFMLSRELAQPKEFHGHLLPKGTLLNLLFMATHHDPRFWENPEEFKPERFDPQSEETHQRHPFSFLPFSAGPRGCIGKRLALMEAHLILAAILSSYDVTGPTENVYIDGTLLSKPCDYLVTFTPRVK